MLLTIFFEWKNHASCQLHGRICVASVSIFMFGPEVPLQVVTLASLTQPLDCAMFFQVTRDSKWT